MELYNGKATIAEVYTENLQKWQINPSKGASLSEDEAASSFNIFFKVDTPNGDSFTLDAMEVSPRELTGKLLEIYADKVQGRQPVQSDVTLQTLKRLKLIAEADLDHIAEVFNAVGREVDVQQKETESNGKTYLHTQFAFGPKKLSQDELMAKLAKLQGKPVPAQAESEEPAPF